MEGDSIVAIATALDANAVMSIAQVRAQFSSTDNEIDDAAVHQMIEEDESLHRVGDLVFSRASIAAGRVFTARTTTPRVVDDHYDLSPLLGAQKFLDQPEGVLITSPDRTVAVVAAVPTTLDSSGHYISIGLAPGVATSEFGAVTPDRFIVDTVASSRLGSGEVEVAALRSAIQRFLPERSGLSAIRLIAGAIALNDRCFLSATLPISDLFAAAGLVRRDGEWGRANQEWATTSEDIIEVALDQLIADHQLSSDEAGDFRSVILQWQQWVGGRGTVNASSFVALLTGRVAAAFAEYWQPPGAASLENWMDQRRLVETLARKHGDHPGVNYLRGMIDLRLGDGGAALSFFERAHAVDEDFLPVRRELGRLFLDASRIEEAMDILPSDVPIFGSVEYLIDRATVDRSAADRNDACRCGSGRKYRSCCAKQLRLSDREQFALIDVRIQAYLAEPPWSIQMERLADIVSTEWGLMSFPEALADPFVQDILTIEAGGAAAYLAARRSVVTEDDEAILSTFTAGSREAFDVEVLDSSTWKLSDPDSDKELTIDAMNRRVSYGDAVLVRTMERDGRLVAMGPAVFIPSSHVSLLRVTLGSRPTAEQLLGWVCRRTEILRPSIDLTGDIDLRDSGEERGDADAFAGINIDDLARRAMES